MFFLDAHRNGLRHALLGSFAVVALGLGAVACGPTYPNCENDVHCKDKGEVCYNQKCAQCRDDSHCPNAGTDKCVYCATGRCAKKPNCCNSELDCGSGMKCVANQCKAACDKDGDCGADKECRGGRCVDKGKAECTKDADCGKGRLCKNNHCEDKPVDKTCCGEAGGRKTLESINFDFNEAKLRSDAQSSLEASVACIKKESFKSIIVEGHCDERGSEGYNMELGNRRAKSAKDFLTHAVSHLKVKSVSFGKTKPLCSDATESCWSQNRRAEFKIK